MTGAPNYPAAAGGSSTPETGARQGSNGSAVAPPVVLTVPEAARALKISRWSIYQLIRTRRLATVKIGRRRLVPATALQDLIGRLDEEAA